MAFLARLIMTAACLAVPMLAQKVSLEIKSDEPLEELKFQVFAPTTAYSIAVDKCPDSDRQCTVIQNQGTSVSMTYEFDAVPLRGKQVRFAASLLVNYPGLSRAQLFMRVDRPAGIGFHEYSPRQNNTSHEWKTPEIVGTIDPDAKRVTIGLRCSGRGVVYFAGPEFEIVPK